MKWHFSHTKPGEKSLVLLLGASLTPWLNLRSIKYQNTPNRTWSLRRLLITPVVRWPVYEVITSAVGCPNLEIFQLIWKEQSVAGLHVATKM